MKRKQKRFPTMCGIHPDISLLLNSSLIYATLPGRYLINVAPDRLSIYTLSKRYRERGTNRTIAYITPEVPARLSFLV